MMLALIPDKDNITRLDIDYSRAPMGKWIICSERPAFAFATIRVIKDGEQHAGIKAGAYPFPIRLWMI